MSWSLMLSPRLSPAVLLGVSHRTFPKAVASDSTIFLARSAPSQPHSPETHDFPEQLSAPCGALLSLGVPAELEELPITAA